MKTLLERMPAWREKFWLIPAVAVAIAAIGAELLIAVGSNFDVSDTPFYDGSADSAQGILSAVATSSLSLAGTVFFITLTALSGVVTVMGPRLLHEFLKDRSIQSTLAIYLATFIFALLSLRAVRTGGGGVEELRSFPQCSRHGSAGHRLRCLPHLLHRAHCAIHQHVPRGARGCPRRRKPHAPAHPPR